MLLGFIWHLYKTKYENDQNNQPKINLDIEPRKTLTFKTRNNNEYYYNNAYEHISPVHLLETRNNDKNNYQVTNGNNNIYDYTYDSHGNRITDYEHGLNHKTYYDVMGDRN
jgi:hypothetical protein